MRRLSRAQSRLFCALLVIGLCGQARSSELSVWESAKPENLSEHFRYYTAGYVPNEVMENLSSGLIENRERILASMGVAEMPQVGVKVFGDFESFSEAFGPGLAGGRAFVNPDKNEVYVLNVSWTDITKTTVHEFAHLVVAMVNRNIPRWLWESSAIYETQETIGDGSTLSCITPSQYPTLEDLNKSHTTYDVKVYRVGYTLIEYVVSEFGDDARLNLIRSGGNIQEALGVTTTVFEDGWHKFVLNNYRIPDVGVALNKQQVHATMLGNTFTTSDDRYRFSINSDGSIDFSSPLTPRFFGLPDAPSQRGQWTVSPQGEVCVSSADFDATACISWYLDEDNLYRQTLETDCKWFVWRLDE